MQGVVRTLGSSPRSSAALKDLASCLGGRSSLGVHSPGGVGQSSSVHTEAEGLDTGGEGGVASGQCQPGKGEGAGPAAGVRGGTLKGPSPADGPG